MPGKKWCQYCRINISYNRKDIEDHQATRNHLQNKQKAIQFQRNKIRKQKQQQKRNQTQALLSIANIPKAKRGSQLEKQVQNYRNSVFQQGKSAIHKLIAQKTQGIFGAPIQYPQKQQLVLAQNYDSVDQQNQQKDDKNYEMWKIDVCQKTGDPCFINRITKLVLYQPPKGYLLSKQQQQEWQYLKQICKQKIQINPQATVNISQWQQVADQQNYFQVNKIQSDQQQDQSKKHNNVNKQQHNSLNYSKYMNKTLQTKEQDIKKQEVNIKQKPKTFKQQLQQKLINNQISTNEVFQKFIQYEMKNSRTIKQKNQNLKKLIQSGIQIRARPTDDELLGIIKQQQDKPKVTFKARKKVKPNVQLTQQNDIY